MKNIITLDLHGVMQDDKADNVLKSISTGMRKLQCLNLSDTNVSCGAIRYLFPTETQGCPDSIQLVLMYIQGIDVDFLKEVTMALVQLQELWHPSVINLLAELRDDEASLGSCKSLTSFYLPSTYDNHIGR